MKRMSRTILIFALILSLPVAAAQAQSTTAPKTGEKAPVASEDSIDQLGIKNQPLSVRKQKAETDLKGLITQLGLFYTRTQSALDRLADKNVDTTKSQQELDIANTFLSDAKANFALFSKIVVPESKQEKAAADLKISAKKTEESLRSAREHLMNALSFLKEAVNASITATQ